MRLILLVIKYLHPILILLEYFFVYSIKLLYLYDVFDKKYATELNREFNLVSQLRITLIIVLYYLKISI